MTHEQILYGAIGLFAMAGINVSILFLWEFWRSRRENASDFVGRREHDLCSHHHCLEVKQIRKIMKDYYDESARARGRIEEKLERAENRLTQKIQEVLVTVNGHRK